MKFSLPKRTTNTSISKRLMAWTAVCAVLVCMLLTYSKTAHAGLVSFISSVMGSERAAAKITQPSATANSQTIALLQAAANRDPNPEKPSDIIPVDNEETLVAELAAADAGSDAGINTQISIYTVQSGDTLSGIAQMFDVSINTILWANDLTGKSVLKQGQTLVILPVSGISYTVKKGDTLQAISKKYSSDLDEILAYNDLPSASSIRAGQTILIPNGEVQASTPARTTTARSSPIKASEVPDNPAHDTNGPSYPGYYTRPIKGGVRTQGLHGYNGVDLADKAGTPIYAAAAGTVIVARTGGWNGGYGNFIIISHANGTQTLYAHASQNLVSVGEKVVQGQKIALMGATGLATGPHVHFEIRGAKNPF